MIRDATALKIVADQLRGASVTILCRSRLIDLETISIRNGDETLYGCVLHDYSTKLRGAHPACYV